uniref:Hypoxia up-regulated protein 1 n=1 Tax=Timema genevievae TaxID=629358 RepID=A0A7R9JX04_TIMGE|nr:unnamed protein product [Timema genevievae]
MAATSCLFLAMGLAAFLVPETYAVAVMSVDLGSEWMKIAIVSPGVPMEIALNKESKRKTPVTIAFRDGERTFGEDATTVAVRFPKNSYSYLLDLLGKKLDNPVVKLFQKRFPYYELVADPERGTVLFQHDSETQYSVEELVGMLLHQAQEFAQDSAGQAINDAVIIVPGFFNQAERSAMLQAADLAGLKVLQLMNDYTAVALNYGIFRRKDFNETAQYIMFYDMGATSTTATVVSYQLVKTKERGFIETNPQLSVLGVGYDRFLGGLEIQLQLRDYLGRKFNELKKTPNDVFKNPRALAKLFKEAGRLKNVLSANADHYAQVEGLLDDIDFRMQVTREMLEELNADLFERVKLPVEQALKASGLTMDVINQVILVGAGTRVPKVQEKLTEFVQIELGKNINTDEAAALGAAYKAADLSNGFKVKKFVTKDSVLFPIQVVFERDMEGLSTPKQVKRTLFGYTNPYPQKKLLTFNKHQDDFSFNVNYADLEHLPPIEIDSVQLTGVADALAKNQGPNIESKGIKVHFSMDESGILNLVNVELVLEKTVTDEELEESTLSKLGSTISKLFTGSDEKVEGASEEKPVSSDESGKEGEEQKTDAGEQPNKVEEEKVNTTKTGDKKPKVVVVKEPITAKEERLGVLPLGEGQLQDSLKKIETLNVFDQKKRRREVALNALESFVFDAQNKLHTDEYQKAATKDEVAQIKNTCSEVSDWLYDEGEDAPVELYDQKLSELRTLTGALYRRVRENQERPEALAVLHSMINSSTNFLAGARNVTAQAPEGGMFTPVELDTLDRVIKETKEWKQKMEGEQAALTPTENPKLTVKLITEKMAVLDREVKYLVNKAKIWRPKKSKEDTKDSEPAPNKTVGEEETVDEEGIVEEVLEGGEQEAEEVTTSTPPSTEEPEILALPPAEESVTQPQDHTTEQEHANEPSWLSSALIVCTIHLLFVLTPA